MRIKVYIILLFLALFQSWNLYAQNQNQEKDSIKVINIAKDFFNWYITVTKKGKYIEYQPQFVQSKNRMTTLNYSKYIKNLKKHAFSDSLIAKEKQSYQECICNLEKVKYKDFKVKFIDLNDFESTNCDFTNYYRWTGGQEMYDGYTVLNVYIDKNNAIVVGAVFNNDSKNKDKKNIMGDISMTLIRQNNVWKISGIKY